MSYNRIYCVHPPPPHPTLRVKQDARREKPAPNIDIVRHYAALLAQESKPPNATKRLVEDDYGGVSTSPTGERDNDRDVNCIVKGLRRRHRRGGPTRRRRSNSNRKRRGKDKDSKEEHAFDTNLTRESGASATVLTDGGWMVGGKECENNRNNVEPHAGLLNSGLNGSTGEKRAPQHQHQSRGDCNADEDDRSHCDSDTQNTHNSDYEESFESTGGTEESDDGALVADVSITAANNLEKSLGAPAKNHGLANRDDGANEGIGDGNSRREESTRSGLGATMIEGRLSEDAAVSTTSTAATIATAAATAAAALRIEACWRGFLGRCSAKRALRSALLNALRNIGGGKISKVNGTSPWEIVQKAGLPLNTPPSTMYDMCCAL